MKKKNRIMLFAINPNDFMAHRYELIEMLLENKYEVILVANPGTDVPTLEQMGAKYIPVVFDNHSTNPIKDFILALKLRRLIKLKNPDIILTFYTKTNIYGSMAAKWCKVPYITTITGLGSALEYEGLLQKIMIHLYRYALSGASNIIYQNQANMDFMHQAKIRPELGILVAGSGVNIKKFSYSEYPDENQIEFLFLSRVLREKGIEEYLEAANYFHKINPEIKFHIVGQVSDYKNKIIKMHSEGIVIYHGQQKDVRKFIKRCCCTIFPSYYPEGMANVLLESAAMGRPVITTGRAGCGEAVDDGDTGYIVSTKDSADLIYKIRKFIELPYLKKIKMGYLARMKMEKQFNRDFVISEYLKEINKLLK